MLNCSYNGLRSVCSNNHLGLGTHLLVKVPFWSSSQAATCYFQFTIQR